MCQGAWRGTMRGARSMGRIGEQGPHHRQLRAGVEVLVLRGHDVRQLEQRGQRDAARRDRHQQRALARLRAPGHGPPMTQSDPVLVMNMHRDSSMQEPLRIVPTDSAACRPCRCPPHRLITKVTDRSYSCP